MFSTSSFNFGLAVLSLSIADISCYVAYEQFPGFEITSTSTIAAGSHFNKSSPDQHQDISKSKPLALGDIRNNTKSIFEGTTPSIKLPEPIINPKFLCPEYEKPVNIGPYEVPTQRDIVFQVKSSLTRLFNSYHEKALYFLKDIKTATKATTAIEKACSGPGADRLEYRRCVAQVGHKCEVITKELVKALEIQREDVVAFTNGTICNVKGLKADPVTLIKTLAVEEASLEFALPGYLRLLSSCSIYCEKLEPKKRSKKPLRHMTDQDLVVKHFLTKKNYIQLLKETN